jgi:hypothetical protein
MLSEKNSFGTHGNTPRRKACFPIQRLKINVLQLEIWVVVLGGGGGEGVGKSEGGFEELESN